MKARELGFHIPSSTALIPMSAHDIELAGKLIHRKPLDLAGDCHQWSTRESVRLLMERWKEIKSRK